LRFGNESARRQSRNRTVCLGESATSGQGEIFESVRPDRGKQGLFVTRQINLLLLGATLLAARASAAFTTFETGQVRPLALSPDGTSLFAVNTPDGHLEIFDVSPAGQLSRRAAVPVGLEPVAVAPRTDAEVWVVNHLSDSLSVVDVASSPPRVVRTIPTCDEPRDIVFAGSGRSRAFVTAARRGQTCRGPGGPIDPQLTTPGIARALVQVFDASGTSNVPIAAIELFGDTPRALAASPDDSTVYAAVFLSGNRSTTVTDGAVCDGGGDVGPCDVFGTIMPGGLPAPSPLSCKGETQPEAGLIVQHSESSGEWEDGIGRPWTEAVRFDLPDWDVFAIDATTDPPTASGGAWAGVGTVLFNMAVNPVRGTLYVTNTEARNLNRFEGDRAGSCAAGTVRGRLHEARVTVIDGPSVQPRHLNPHLEPYDSTAGDADGALSLATPVDLVVSPDGATAYVAAHGSSSVGVIDTAALEAGTRTPDVASRIRVSGGGPSGVVLRGDRLFVLTRFDNAISIVDTTTRRELAHLPLYSPEPASVRLGRRFLYDAAASSANGEAACAACHVFGDLDGLAWDLGDPDADTLRNANGIEFGDSMDFFALKGPMTTQSLRGLANHGPMHWRGDRSGGNDPGGNPYDEDAAFKRFNVAFVGLLGRERPLTAAEMQAFTDFMLQVTYPPNPIRALDGSRTPAEERGRELYFGPLTDTARTCNNCHVLDRAAGFFGTDGDMAAEGEPQVFKIPHLRNAYQKVGMFGMPAVPFIRQGANEHIGAQVRGFGFLHDGSVDTVFRFLRSEVFTVTDQQARDLEQFVLAFDSEMAPVVGQQATLSAATVPGDGPRVDLLVTRADLGECDLVVKGALAGVARGWLRTAGHFQSDRRNEPPLGDAALRALASTPGQELTYTCTPPGSGVRAGIDRDEDGELDGDDALPDDPVQRREAATTTRLTLNDDPQDPTRRRARLVGNANDLDLGLGKDSADDPVLVGGSVRLLAEAGDRFDATYPLPASGWRYLRGSLGIVGYAYRDRRQTNGPVRRAVVKKRRGFRLSASGPGLIVRLETNPNPVRVRLRIGAKLYCADAGSERARFTSPTRFVARGRAAPGSCP
jgi:YVTN family beta-propeller protein